MLRNLHSQQVNVNSESRLQILNCTVNMINYIIFKDFQNS